MLLEESTSLCRIWGSLTWKQFYVSYGTSRAQLISEFSMKRNLVWSSWIMWCWLWGRSFNSQVHYRSCIQLGLRSGVLVQQVTIDVAIVYNRGWIQSNIYCSSRMWMVGVVDGWHVTTKRLLCGAILRQREGNSSSREPGVSYKDKAHRGAAPLHLREGAERWYQSSPDQHGRIESGHLHQGISAFEAL